MKIRVCAKNSIPLFIDSKLFNQRKKEYWHGSVYFAKLSIFLKYKYFDKYSEKVVCQFMLISLYLKEKEIIGSKNHVPINLGWESSIHLIIAPFFGVS